jgi:hypothetical protein
MATWGEFIKEIPIINKKAEGIWVKVDHVIDLWEERNKLREELAELKEAANPTSGQGAEAVVPEDRSESDSVAPSESAPAAEPPPSEAAVRERCAQEVEACGQVIPVAPEQREFVAQLLQAVANRLRGKEDQEVLDFLSRVEIPPQAAPADAQASFPQAEPMGAAVPMAHPVEQEEGSPPMAEPVSEGEALPMAEVLGDALLPMAEILNEGAPEAQPAQEENADDPFHFK